MNSILFLVILFVVFGLIFAGVAFFAYRRALRRAKGVERGLKMVPLLIHLPPPADDEERSANRDSRQLLQEKISQAEVLYDLISGTAQQGFKSNFYGQRHIALEIVASGGLIHYFVAVPVSMVSVIEQAILTAYPGARMEEVEDHNIFNPQGKLTGTAGGELVLKHSSAYPISTYKHIERDPMEALLNALSKLQPGDGAAVQIMIRPARKNWTKAGIRIVAKKRKTKRGDLSFTPGEVVRAAYKTPQVEHQEDQMYKPSKLEESVLEQIEEKTRYPGYETLIRVMASSPTYDKSQMLLRNITNAFSLYESPGMNGFQFYPARDVEGLVTAFIFRFFPPELTSNILNSPELATVFHLPDAQYTPTSQLQRQTSKQVDGPVQSSSNGLLMGYNLYRGTKKEIRLSPEDRRRHTYIVGQTGTGKSTILENLAVQDMLAGNGFAFIDPHGDTAEKLISMVPKERAEDVIYFNPSDTERPLGLNLFEFSDPAQKDFLVNEAINMLYKIYDPGKTGIIGPRFEHWFRNAALTLMADPNGASLIEIPKVFTDADYLKNKFKYLKDPTVIDFWTKEMGQTSDYHKSEMLGWFVSKFGAFMSNELMRNIIGQTKSSFNLRDIMDNKKILIVNLSKGKLGDINAQYLGMIFVIKFQAAAMSRASVAENQRPDFCLYVDEFQNYSTDSFASILSEARKYHLNLVVANQFIGQLSDEIRDAVFGNVGTIMSYRCGPEDAEFLVKQFAPIFDVRDLVGLPNFNAVMRLMTGGLPSRPFSVTALPPLGVAHQEMGLAVKQLSAAKFGIPRAQAESDIFARLQAKPAPAPAATPAPAPVPTSPPVAPIPAQMPAVAPAAAPPQASATAASQVVPVTASALPKPAVSLAATPSADIASVVGQVSIPAKPAPAPVPASVQVSPVQPVAPAPSPVSPPPQATPSTQPSSAPTATPPPATVPSLTVMHNQVQDEINELANAAMHKSEEQVDEPVNPNQTSAKPVVVDTPTVREPVNSTDAEPIIPSNSEPAKLTTTTEPVLPEEKAVQSEGVRSPSSKPLAIEPPHELLLPEHAGAEPPKMHSTNKDKPQPKLEKQSKAAQTHHKSDNAAPTTGKPAKPNEKDSRPAEPSKSSKPEENAAPVPIKAQEPEAKVAAEVKADIAAAPIIEKPVEKPVVPPVPAKEEIKPPVEAKAAETPASTPTPTPASDLAESTLHSLEAKLESLPTTQEEAPKKLEVPQSEFPVKESASVPVIDLVNPAPTESETSESTLESSTGEIRVDAEGNVIMS